MVGQVRADSGKVDGDADAVPMQFVRRADSRRLPDVGEPMAPAQRITSRSAVTSTSVVPLCTYVTRHNVLARRFSPVTKVSASTPGSAYRAHGSGTVGRRLTHAVDDVALIPADALLIGAIEVVRRRMSKPTTASKNEPAAGCLARFARGFIGPCVPRRAGSPAAAVSLR
jgi:hypothetical protein